MKEGFAWGEQKYIFFNRQTQRNITYEEFLRFSGFSS
jgi:hypothetical protein